MVRVTDQLQRVTIHDVARTAGVSAATVSKVINGRYGVASATVQRVQKVIDDLGYESSLVARSLRSHRTNVVGILVAEFEPFSTEILKGVSQAVGGTGYELLAYSGGGRAGTSVGWERRYLSRLGGTLIDGAILVTPTVVDSGGSVPVVAIDPHSGPSGMPTVDSDNFTGALVATEHLLELGHRRVGFLGGRPDLESSRLREEGYRTALATAGIPVEPELMRVGGYRRESAHEPAHELLSLPQRPTAIFAANDLSAIGTMDVARELGLRIPDDLSIVGFDNVPESVLTSPPLTTISQPIQLMGSEALRLLIHLMDGTDERSTHVQLPTELIERASTGAPATSA
ncbi:LacI family transcriptional regulator [Cellulomonas fimi]|uniref:LacI family transcriptional regulator n=1 Tax=Cellulomonas fimi TaxID=1708 RepID=A0A7Y0LYW3_CELFI|nr:LacI family transcriptional regulator [Cellulomonas fimi]